MYWFLVIRWVLELHEFVWIKSPVFLSREMRCVVMEKKPSCPSHFRELLNRQDEVRFKMTCFFQESKKDVLQYRFFSLYVKQLGRGIFTAKETINCSAAITAFGRLCDRASILYIVHQDNKLLELASFNFTVSEGVLT